MNRVHVSNTCTKAEMKVGREVTSWRMNKCVGGDQQVWNRFIFSSVQFSRSVVSNSLRPHGLQHVRPPCPSPAPRVYPISCPLSRWYHPTIISSVVPFSCPQSFPASGSFKVSQFFTSVQFSSVTESCLILRNSMNCSTWGLPVYHQLLEFTQTHVH